MKIRAKLIILFTGIVAAILLTSSAAIYLSQSEYRQQEFFERMKNRAVNTARLYIEVKEVDSSLLQIIDQHTLTLAEEDIVIYDNGYRKIYDSNLGLEQEVSKELLNKVFKQGEIRFVANGKEWLGILFTGRQNHYIIITSAFDRYGLSKLRNLRIVLIIVCITSVIITIIAGWFFVGLVLRPISRIVNEVEQISASNLDARVNVGNGKDELAKLAETFNRMLQRLETAFEIQRNFVSNASHELRTPLTALKAQIEVTLLKKRDAEEYEKILRSLHDDIKNMSDLTNGLLALAQASLVAHKLPQKHVRVDELLWQTQAELQRNTPQCNVIIDFENHDLDEKSLTVIGNEQLLKTSFLNLFENACKFSTDKRVNVLIDTNTRHVTIAVSDNGIGIPKEEIGKIFEPFYRGTNAHPIRGHGLGLSLTSKVIELHNGTIKVKSEPGQGTTFTVRLPNI